MDLAGSERANRTKNEGARLKEAANINNSLLTFGRCIEILRWNQQHNSSAPKIVPFRDTKLTRLFQDFFVGSCRAVLFIFFLYLLFIQSIFKKELNKKELRL